MDESWLKTFGLMTHGIYVLTTAHNDGINGMIASWVSQVSYDPPIVSVAVHPNRYSHRMIRDSGRFALHPVSRTQRTLLRQFMGSDPEAKFHDLRWEKGKTGSPILQDCLGYLDCLVRETFSPGNHTVFLGEVVDAGLFSREDPMSTLDYEGVYTGKK